MVYALSVNLQWCNQVKIVYFYHCILLFLCSLLGLFLSFSRALSVYVVGMMTVHSLCCFTGIVLYALYAGCDPVTSGKIQRNDEVRDEFDLHIFVYFMGNRQSLDSDAYGLDCGMQCTSLYYSSIRIHYLVFAGVIL